MSVLRGVVPALALAAVLLTSCSQPEDPDQPTAAAPAVSTTATAAAPATTAATATTATASAVTSTATATTPSGSVPASVASEPAHPTPTRIPAPPTPSPAPDHGSPASLQVLVNKRNPLHPTAWAPADLTAPDVRATRAGLTLRAEAAAAAEDLFAAAAAEGVDLTLVSAYRSYSYQQGTYAGWVQQHGRAGADRISARPGHSEHQTGLAMDVGAVSGACTLQACFGNTPEGAWVALHAAEHGWIVRYPAGAEDITGYSPEPWHLRYVGTEAAADVVRSGGVLETAWGLAPAPDYGP
ncbi:MAG: M15 family metallopeptidase [Micrococcus sp.]|nr:M15 family metallopeptidase [Micrococcus sp.]